MAYVWPNHRDYPIALLRFHETIWKNIDIYVQGLLPPAKKGSILRILPVN